MLVSSIQIVPCPLVLSPRRQKGQCEIGVSGWELRILVLIELDMWLLHSQDDTVDVGMYNE